MSPLAALQAKHAEAVAENERLIAGTLWQQERNLALTKRIAELESKHAEAVALLRKLAHAVLADLDEAQDIASDALAKYASRLDAKGGTIHDGGDTP